MYRMRPIEHLLGEHRELERQAIFFSELKALNDPMEGFLRFAWNGDRIVWENLLAHYLLCLEHVLWLSKLADDGRGVTPKDIPIFKTIEDLPSERYRDAFKAVMASFLANEQIRYLIDFLSSRTTPVHEDELICHLKFIHFFALHSVLSAHKDLGFDKSDIPADFAKLDIRSVLDIWKENRSQIETNPQLVAALFRAQIHSHAQMSLIITYQEYEKARSQIKRFLLFEFTEEYVYRLRELAYPNAYVACFMSDCTSVSAWGHYADGHRGVCLKFRTTPKEGVETLALNTVIGWGQGPVRGVQPQALHKVRYSLEFQSVDFFRSLGGLPIGILDKYWYTDRSGTRSVCSVPLGPSEERDVWHKEFWATHIKCLTSKLPAWKDEEEYRIVIEDTLRSHEDPDNRTLYYDFRDLEGIVFGSRTKTDDKIQIMKIVDRKCKENSRKDFKFYQAELNDTTGTMRMAELGLLRIE